MTFLIYLEMMEERVVIKMKKETKQDIKLSNALVREIIQDKRYEKKARRERIRRFFGVEKNY